MGQLLYRTCAGNPNTLNEVGAVSERIFDTTNKIWYTCRTAGTGAWYSKDGFLLGEILDYEITLSQASTGVPTVDDQIKNMFGSVPVFYYTSVGSYHFTFTDNWTTIIPTVFTPTQKGIITNGGVMVGFWSAKNSTAKNVILYTFNLAGTLANDLLTATYLFWKVYPAS
jgi:hypothetical protein